MRLSFLLATLFFQIHLVTCQIPKYPKSGIYFKYEDFVKGKIVEKSYNAHSVSIANFDKDESGKKFFKTPELWGFVDKTGNLYVTSPFFEKNHFYAVVLEGEINYYKHHSGSISENEGNLTYLPGLEEGGYISKGYDGKWFPATYENLNKILGQNYDCEAAIAGKFKKNVGFRTFDVKANILLCVYVYNQSKL